MKTVADFKQAYQTLPQPKRPLFSVKVREMNGQAILEYFATEDDWCLDQHTLGLYENAASASPTDTYYPGWFEVMPDRSPQSHIRSLWYLKQARKLSVGPVGLVLTTWAHAYHAYNEILPFFYFYLEEDAVSFVLMRDAR